MTFPVSIKATLWVVLAAAALPGLLADSISVKKSCFYAGESIAVRFAKDSSQDLQLSWIGIYKADDVSYTQSLPYGEMWVNLCGKQACDAYKSPREGTVQFQSKYQSWHQSWPLQPGSYVAVMSSDEAADEWPVLAISETFEIGCEDVPDQQILRKSRTSRISNSVSVSKECFESSDQIEVRFTKSSSMNLESTWVAIYESHSIPNRQNLPVGELQVNLCGSQSCSSSSNPMEGLARFRPSNHGWLQSIESGSYVAVLVERDEGGNLVALAVSDTFDITCQENGSDPRNGNEPSSDAAEISVDKECYNVGEDIMVDFVKGSEGNLTLGWIAIYDNEKVGKTGTWPSGELWANPCGSQTCNSDNSPQRGTVRFQSSSLSWLQSWPLSEGSYVVMLTGKTGNAWHVRATSRVFKVGGCVSVRSGGDDDDDDSGTGGGSEIMVPIIADARAKIRSLIERNGLLAGKFLRLAFHDCVGGCDGCIDITNDDNAGLVLPIRSLEAIVSEYEPKGLSRTDVWMLSAVVASEVTELSKSIDFPFQRIGRKTCTEINNNECGVNARGRSSPCDQFSGPHRELCHGDISGTRTIHNFMRDEFGFDAQKTTAIMGAHSIGAMHDVNLGFEGRNGWDLTNHELDHGFFVELVGDSRMDAPDWKQVLRRNDHLAGIPSRWQFEAKSGGLQLTMLNSDIAMVRNLVEGENLDSEGRVSCNFNGTNSCESNTPFMPFMRRYADSRTAFLEDYREALELMIENGYSRDRSCGQGEVCKLRSLS